MKPMKSYFKMTDLFPLRSMSLMWIIVCVLPVVRVEAQETLVLKFRDQPTTEHSIVRLRDLVEVLAGQTAAIDQLLDITISPSPRLGDRQSWHRSDVEQHLRFRGMADQSVRWNGGDYVELTRTAPLSEALHNSITPAFVDERIIDQAEQNVELAIREYVSLHTGDHLQWNIEADIPPKYAPLLRSRQNIVAIGGGVDPWEGEQTFVLQVKNKGTQMSIEVNALVAAPPMIVVAARPIRKDQVIAPEDLKFSPLNSSNTKLDSAYFGEVAEVVGQQARRSISSGVAVTQDLIGPPVVVRRNDLIEVESIAGSIVVRTSAKALSSGAVGDLIEVETPTRHRLHAVVAGPTLARITAMSKSSELTAN